MHHHFNFLHLKQKKEKKKTSVDALPTRPCNIIFFIYFHCNIFHLFSIFIAIFFIYFHCNIVIPSFFFSFFFFCIFTSLFFSYSFIHSSHMKNSCAFFYVYGDMDLWTSMETDTIYLYI